MTSSFARLFSIALRSTLSPALVDIGVGTRISAFREKPAEAARKVGQHGGFTEYKVDKTLEALGDFGQVAGEDGNRRATSAGGSTVDTWKLRLGFGGSSAFGK